MAGKATNSAIQRLRQRQEAETAALVAVTGAVDAVERAQQRRSAELERLDAAVSDADATLDAGLAVLASLMAPDVAASVAEVTPSRMRLAQQRASAEDVTARVRDLSGGALVPRRRGRPPGSRGPHERAGRDRDSGAPGVPAPRAGLGAPVGLSSSTADDNPTGTAG